MMFIDRIRQGLKAIGSDEKPVGAVGALIGRLLNILVGEPLSGPSIEQMDTIEIGREA